MRLPDSARQVLLTAEQQLVSFANEASQSRDYDGATSLLEAARRVKVLADDGQGSAPAMPQQAAAVTAVRATETGSDKAVATPANRRPRKTDYPKFLRDGETLVKVGWSKAEKAEYEHKSPKRVLEVLAEAIAATGAHGRRFTMDKLLPLADPADSTTLPDYQCYLCLALLRHHEMVTQHGRQGYSLPKNADLPSAVERLWGQLSNRQ